jgi:2'-5' RNA ligase
VRLFAAVDLSRDTKDALAAEQARIAASLGDSRHLVKWVALERAHLTLVFLGHLVATDVPPLVEAMKQDVDVAPFEIAFGGVGVFPSRGAPRVLWVGLVAGDSQLRAVQSALAARIVTHGVVIEARAFHPHVTLGRWSSSRPVDRATVVAAAQDAIIAQEHVRRATLFESRLSSSGAAYSVLAHANLNRT